MDPRENIPLKDSRMEKCRCLPPTPTSFPILVCSSTHTSKERLPISTSRPPCMAMPNERRTRKQRTMRLDNKKLAFLAVCTFCTDGRADRQSATNHLQRLVEISAQRLVVAERVALAKWDSGTLVENASREAKVILSACASPKFHAH